MKIKPIRTEKDYEAALRVVSPIFDNPPVRDTPEGDYCFILIRIVSTAASYFVSDYGVTTSLRA